MDIYVRDLENGQAELVIDGVVDCTGSYEEMASHRRSVLADIEQDERNAAHECAEDEFRNS